MHAFCNSNGAPDISPLRCPELDVGIGRARRVIVIPTTRALPTTRSPPPGRHLMFDTSETDRLLSTTRAVRRRLDLDRPVEPEVVLDCLRLAVQAPTASNERDWHWMGVTDPAKRTALADLSREAGSAHLERAPQSESDSQT